jgi:hypothetical protein
MDVLSAGKVKEYTRFYGAFRGVDFSNDHTQVAQNRFAYLVNMYKDYGNGQGVAVETIPGYRRRFDLYKVGTAVLNGRIVLTDRSGNDTKIYGIYKHGNYIIAHYGAYLVAMQSDKDYNVVKEKTLFLGEKEDGQTEYAIECDLGAGIVSVIVVSTEEGVEPTDITSSCTYQTVTQGFNVIKTIKIPYSSVNENVYAKVQYCDAIIGEFSGYSNKYEVGGSYPCAFFSFKDSLYFIHEGHYVSFNGGFINVLNSPIIPTTYKDISPTGITAENEYQQRNLLTPKFKNTFIADGTKVTFELSSPADSITSVKVYGTLQVNGDYTADTEDGKIVSITFTNAPSDPLTEMYPEGYAGVEITASQSRSMHPKLGGVSTTSGEINPIAKYITHCKIAAVFDNRVFLTGSFFAPNVVWYCGIDTFTGLPTPTYFGELDFVPDGMSNVQIKSMLTVSDSLIVLKEESQGDSAMFIHYPVETGDNIVPKIYPSKSGLPGVGSLGAARVFIDDPVFVSELGLEGISKLEVASERSIEHRSSLIDVKLTNNNLKDAVLEECLGYLCLLVDGKLFLGDSRQIYQGAVGNAEYEWYYVEDVGVKVGDTFYKAMSLLSVDNNLFFGTENGVVCSFNFDQRKDTGEFSASAYTFDGRTILCGCATKMDNCDVPTYTKTTVKRSLVIKTKTYEHSAAKVKVRTNKSPYKQLARINAGYFTLESTDFSDFSFIPEGETLFSVKEKEKQWVEKQYYVFSDEYEKPFALYNIAYRFRIAGNYKGK